jgi:hypothetical protein
MYKGDFKNNHKDGFGTFEYVNGCRFEGSWKCDLIDGPGTYYF